MRDLSHHELRSLAALCSGGAMLLAVAVFFSGGTTPFVSPVFDQNQAAATALGISQGVPSFSVTAPYPASATPGYPMPVTCYNYGSEVIRNYNNYPACPGSSNIAVFSIHKKGDLNGQTALLNETSFFKIFSKFATYSQTTVGTPVNTNLGDTLTLEWSCQPSQTTVTTMCRPWWQGGCNDTYENYGSSNYFETGSSFGSGKGTKDIAAPAPGVMQSYTLTCNGTAGAQTLTLSVNPPAPPAPPTLTIKGNGTNPTSVTVGTPVTIVGTFAASAGDTLQKTALNDAASNALPGVSPTPPAASKSYVFNTLTPGSYTFYPAVQSTYYGSWNNYGQSLVVTVGCPAGQVLVGGVCKAVPACAAGSHASNPPACNVCDSGYVWQAAAPSSPSAPGDPKDASLPSGTPSAGSCVPIAACSGAHQVNPPTCSCDVGYVMQGGVCTLPAASINVLKANPTRVVKGQQTSLSWSTTGMAAGACSLRTAKGTLVSQALSATDLKVTVAEQTVFTLACLTAGPTLTSSVTVTVVPSFQEL